MAKDEKPVAIANPELQQRAFELFTARRAAIGLQVDAVELAKACYRDARSFLEVSSKVDAGEISIDLPKGPQLSDCCAPNLKPTHPINLVSQRFGSLQRVRDVFERLDRDPTMDSLPEYEWGPVEVNCARSLLPSFVSQN